MSTANTINQPEKKSSNILRFLIFSLTLGLAPFYPEPHIIGKVQWLMGGAVGMQPMDWFDLVLHGTPWLLFFGAIIWEAKQKFLG
ncbi:MAG: hypothetical protein DRI71_08695 [Bacteroidetes bacterium]|nr:MAG: hypothetical protein DRI71_08695 [Bacteroidota bacterium]